MQPLDLLKDDMLEASPIVANNRMNRERGLHGNNSYTKDIGLDPARFLRARLQRQELELPYRYLGADDTAGPNYTGQPAVNSYYERR